MGASHPRIGGFLVANPLLGERNGTVAPVDHRVEGGACGAKVGLLGVVLGVTVGAVVHGLACSACFQVRNLSWT